MQTKICTKCDEEFPATIEYFHRAKNGKYGLTSICKNCKLKYREENLEVIRTKEKKYSRSENGRERNKTARKKYYWKHKDLIVQETKKYKFQKPQKYKSRYQFCNAVKLGKIIRPTHCQMCNKEGLVHGHHEDYDKPFEVVWVCPGCHGLLHRKEYTDV